MSDHEYFRELCALAAIGQLSSNENRELTQHLYDCPSCREASAEYAHVVEHQLPKADPIRWRTKGLLPKSATDLDLRDRFLARARVEGVEFSGEVSHSFHPKRRPFYWSSWRWHIAVAAAAVAVMALTGMATSRLQERKALANRSESEARMAQQNQTLRAQLAAIQQNIEQESAGLEAANREKWTSGRALQHLQEELEKSREQSGALSAQFRELEASQAGLAGESHQKDVAIADLNAKNEKLRRDNVEQLTARVLLEAQMRELNESLQQQAMNFERERQLMVASKDVRQLMGARNLHIMDVHDTDGAGNSAKAFGRVFYAEGQSLIFYAFDLPSGKLSAAKYTFQGWAQKESVSHSVRNLGTFSADDRDQRRWVLKVNDPQQLKGIDSVFVTAEVAGDVGTPKGKKLLYAFIVGEPNHP
jgi:hypothetical protein